MNPAFRASTASFVTVVFSFMSVVSGCNSAGPAPPQDKAAVPIQSTASAPTPQSASAPTPEPASAPTAQPVSIDDLVAPIALYPDQLLAQILTASTNVQEVLDGGNWLLQNQNLNGDALVNAAKQAGFSPSMQYLMSFPQVLDNMCQQLDWTSELGQNFQADQKGVMEAVQRKRAQAQQTGNLKSSPQMTVATTKAENGQQYVEIQPANPQVVYVPQYNPVTIYNTPAPPPVVVNQPAPTSAGVSTGTAVAIGLLSFGVGMAVGSAINRNNYYPYPSWGYGGVYYVGRPYYPPPYRPVYPGYRPAYGYHPPPNYHWNQYNKNVNVTVNNNYYGKFNNSNNSTYNRNPNVNNNSTYNRNPNLNNNTNANNRPAMSAGNQANRQPSWKGQSTYQGARPNAPNQGPGSSMANAKPANRPNTNNNQVSSNRPNGAYSGAPANRQSASNNIPATRPNLASSPGGNNTSRPAPTNASAINRPGAASPSTTNKTAAPSNMNRANMNRGGDRGFSSAAVRPAGGAAPATRPAPQAQNRAGGGNSAFSNSGSSKSERVAGNRGQASIGGGSRGRGNN
jgi:hypothetical protein